MINLGIGGFENSAKKGGAVWFDPLSGFIILALYTHNLLNLLHVPMCPIVIRFWKVQQHRSF